ncbi:MAG: glutathione synthase [Rhodospirillaceae bacterium]|nr:glutathione synthase [Rhodospirillaceae bacterium]
MIRAVAIQMDPVSALNLPGDSTFALALEASRRGYRLFHYLAQDLSLADGALRARARVLDVGTAPDRLDLTGEALDLDLESVDVVLMRQDPPFDLAYITATHLLEHVHPRTLVVNDPAAVRNAPEKLLVTHFSEWMPPTLISGDPARIAGFRQHHGDIIVKPLFGNGGAGVFHLRPEDDNLNALLEMFRQQSREPLMVQRYLPDVRQGDKRIILIDGQPAGAVNRVPAKGEARSNMHIGGRPERAVLTEREREICAAIGPTLKERGLIFVGIDVIGGFLTEINVTSPTGIREIDRFDGVNLAALVWNAIEARL